MTHAYVALGSNLGNASQHVLDAIDALGQLPGTALIAVSHLYRTPPWGMLDQPDFVNAAALLDTAFGPHELLDQLLTIERMHGRQRDGARWGPRTLDLDLLHMPGVALADTRLTLPHPRIAERAFVLLPLHDLAPDLMLPGQGRVAALLAAVDRSGCDVLAA
jgi:2-amino-4-hydroxy-6-hydroxymethyldihydropteridine diphosphokinase